MDYYDINKILAEEEKLKVKFNYNIENFGFYINPTLTDIKPNTRVELPFFLIKLLLQNDFCILVENPVERIKHDLDAASHIVDLKNKHFYNLCKYLYDKSYISDVFFERIGNYVSLLVKSNFTEDDCELMSAEEKNMILSARKIFKEFQDFYFSKHEDF